MRNLTDSELKRVTEMTDPPLSWPVQMAEQVVRSDSAMEALIAANPAIPPMTAHIIAGDQISAERATDAVESGKLKPEEAVHLVGSYSRWQWALQNCPQEWVWKNIAELWRGADPDDTDVDNITVWSDAFLNRGERYIRDGKPLPRGQKITLYRGQMPNDPLGIAWTTDLDIAKRFASGVGLRTRMNGVVITGWVWRGLIFGYLTGRKESEVIVRPSDVNDIKVVGVWESSK